MTEKKWKVLHDKHKGETCIVVCNGPSLADVPDEFLAQYPTFGCNRIFLKFTPSYYTAINVLVLEQDITSIYTIERPLFLDYRFVREQDYALYSRGNYPFSYRPYLWIFQGYSVTNVMLQLAYYMGFETVLIIGMDHRYTYTGEPNEEVEAVGQDMNHFSTGYFSNGYRWHNPDLDTSAYYFEKTRIHFDKRNRRIINLTPDSALDVFEKDDLKNWLEKPLSGD